MIRLKFKNPTILNLQTLLIDIELRKDSKLYTLNLFTYYLEFTLEDFIELIYEFILKNIGIETKVEIEGNSLIYLDDLPILEESYNIVLENIESEKKSKDDRL